MPFDADPRDLRVLLEDLEDALQDVLALLARRDLDARRLEPDLLPDANLLALDEGNGTAVLRPIGIGLARAVSACLGLLLK